MSSIFVFLRKNPCLRFSEMRSSSGLESSLKTRPFARAITRMPWIAKSDCYEYLAICKSDRMVAVNRNSNRDDTANRKSDRDDAAICREQSWWYCESWEQSRGCCNSLRAFEPRFAERRSCGGRDLLMAIAKIPRSAKGNRDVTAIRRERSPWYRDWWEDDGDVIAINW